MGYGDVTLPDIYYFLGTPNGIPDDVQSTLEEALSACLKKPDIVEKLGGDGVVPDPFVGPQAAKDELEHDVEVYSEFVDD